MRKSAVLISFGVVLALPGGASAKSTAGRYAVDVAGDTVVDAATKLTWQRAVPSQKFNWANAKVYCSANIAQLPGTDWRLPSRRELLSLVDRKEKWPAIDTTAFPGTPPEYSWSVTPSAGGGYAWAVSFSEGASGSDDLSKALRVRCVR